LIERAAELGGCTQIIDRLPDKFDTYLEHPVQNYFSRIPPGTKSLFGSNGFHKFAGSFGVLNRDLDHGLSGGEEQRLALCVFDLSTLSVNNWGS